MEQRIAGASEANRLYWDTEQSVAEISNQLGLSRRALYDLINPLPAGVECSSCGAELHYANRSAKAAGIARCLVCGNEREIGGGSDEADLSAPSARRREWPRTSDDIATDGRRSRAVTIAGFAIVGVVVGAIATLLVRRRG